MKRTRNRLSQPEERRKKDWDWERQNKLQDPKQNISNKKGFCFAPSQSIVLFAKGENVNLLWKEELGGFALSILISGNSLILGGGVRCIGLGEKAAAEWTQGRGKHKGVYSEYTAGAIWIFNTGLNGKGGERGGVENTKSRIPEEVTKPSVSQCSW